MIAIALNPNRHLSLEEAFKDTSEVVYIHKQYKPNKRFSIHLSDGEMIFENLTEREVIKQLNATIEFD